jgi:hypothetical protein
VVYPVSGGLGTPRILGKGTVSVVEVSTQTPGLAEELWEAKNQYPQGGRTTFRLPTPNLFPPKKGVYEQLQELQGRIKVAKEKIHELKTVIYWQKQTFPESCDQTLEENKLDWQQRLRAAEEEWWELNFPDPARRAQEKLALKYQRTGIQEGPGSSNSKPRPPLPPGPPPPLELVDPPEIYEAIQAAKTAIAARASEATPLPGSANLTWNGQGWQVTHQGPQVKAARTPISERLHLPTKNNPTSSHVIPEAVPVPREGHPRIQVENFKNLKYQTREKGPNPPWKEGEERLRT